MVYSNYGAKTAHYLHILSNRDERATSDPHKEISRRAYTKKVVEDIPHTASHNSEQGPERTFKATSHPAEGAQSLAVKSPNSNGNGAPLSSSPPLVLII